MDTGLNRNGVGAAEFPALLPALRRARADDAIRLRGIMSHLACGDDPTSPVNDLQAQRFAEMRAQARDAGVEFEIAPPVQLAGGHDAARPGLRHGPARHRGVRADADPRAAATWACDPP